MPLEKDMKILLVEDSKIMRKMEMKVLHELGFTNIVEADDGEDAIRKLQETSGLELIISDWNMPGKSGYDLLVWVRAQDPCKHIPFIMATARGEKSQTVKAQEAGVSSFITKPFGPPELKAVIEETFSGTKSEEPNAENFEGPRFGAGGKVLMRVAHIQITDHLTLGVMRHLIASGKLHPRHFELRTECMGGWNPVQQALEKGRVDAAFILAPIAMDLFGFGVPIRLVLFAHKSGSICVRSKGDDRKQALRDHFKGKTFYIPHILSIHHMLSHMTLRDLGLRPGLTGEKDVDVFFEVVPPIKMPEFLAKNPQAAGFTVAEPIGTKAIAAGVAELMFLSGEIWEYHPCCVVCVRDKFAADHPEAVQEWVDMLVQSGRFLSENQEKAARIGVNFLDPDRKLGLNVAVLKNVLREPRGIKTDDLFPVIGDLERIQDYMSEKMGIGKKVDLDRFVDTSFAERACQRDGSPRRASVFRDVSEVLARAAGRQAEDTTSKSMLDKEGKYLFFGLNGQEYGIEIHAVREIIPLRPVRSLPGASSAVKGVINLRGKVIPIVDMRRLFGMEEGTYHSKACIIVLDMGGSDVSRQIGVVVDSVSEVTAIRATDIEEVGSFGADADQNLVMAFAKVKDAVKILLDTDRLLRMDETALFGTDRDSSRQEACAA